MALNHKNISGLIKYRILISVILAVFVLTSGCSVSYKFSGASTVGLNTFSIQYFQNRAPVVQPGLSQNLTDALIDKCKAQTNLKYVNTTADVNFEGEISDYSTRPLTVAADAQAATNRFSISVKVKFTNNVKPELSFDQVFTQYQDYPGGQNLSDVEVSLSDLIVKALVEDIFNQAFVNW
jgi:hypothetical protein